MRDYCCYIYHLEDKRLIENLNIACWAGLNKNKYYNTYVYIDNYIESEITDNQRKRIVYLINKITPCKFKTINGKVYISYKLLNNHYSNLLLLNFIRILWYKNGSFNNKSFFRYFSLFLDIFILYLLFDIVKMSALILLYISITFL